MQDFFRLLGLPGSFDLSLSGLEKQYLLRSRELHPDFHQEASDLEQRASLELSSILNEAYATLRDPFRRAEHLLALQGGPSASEAKEMSPVFLMEMLELREAISALKSEEARNRLEDQLRTRYDKKMSLIGTAFTDSETDRTKSLKQIRQMLNESKYLKGLLRDLNDS